MSQELEQINKKLDILIEQAENTRRRQDEFAELKDDLTPVFSDLFQTAVKELDDVSAYFSSEDLIFLIKKLLRNTRTLIKLFEQLESMTDLIRDVLPLSKDVFDSVLEKADALEKKGVFRLLKEGETVAENALEAYSAGEWTAPEKISLFRLLKAMNQPEVKRSLYMLLSILKSLGTQSITQSTNQPIKNKGVRP